jgi:hypothetical protein
MSLSSYLTKPLRWLRAGYPTLAPRHGYVPLIALMPGSAGEIEDPPDIEEFGAPLTPPRQARDAQPHRGCR